VFELVFFLCKSGNKFIKNKKSTVFEKKMKKDVKKLEKEKIIFMKFVPRRSTFKWTSNKIGNHRAGQRCFCL